MNRPMLCRAVKMPRGGGDTKVFLGNLPPDCKVSDIQQFLDKFGRVRNILIKQGKYGFAEFDDPRDADDAVYELHGRKLLGSRITLEFAKVGSVEPHTLIYLVPGWMFRALREETGELPGCPSTESLHERSTPSRYSTSAPGSAGRT